MTVTLSGPRRVRQLLDLARRRFDLLQRREAIGAVLPVLQAALAELTARLERLPAGSYSAEIAAGYRLQIAAVAQQVERDLQQALTVAVDRTAAESARQVVRELAWAQTALGGSAGSIAPVLPVQEMARLAGVVGGDRSLLDRFHVRLGSVLKNYGAPLVRELEQITAVGLAAGDGPDALTRRLLDAAPDVLRGDWWRAERVARTEVAHAYNTTHAETAKALADEGMDDLMTRWTENVSDDGVAMDDRVAKDSLALHGQLRAPGQPFYDAVNERSVAAPPNRPNDRAVLLTWRASWGEPPGGLARLDAESQRTFAEALRRAE